VREKDAPAVPGDEAECELARGGAAPLHELDALDEQRRGALHVHVAQLLEESARATAQEEPGRP
jgi:hypothetical protein